MPSPTDSDFSALVVDDDAGVRQSLRLCIEAAGARVTSVATARGAIDAMERGRFDVVLLDLWLGSESGMDTLPELLRRQPEAGVIVVTAFASIETAVDAMRRGAVDYLAKPFTPQQVRHAVLRVVEASRLKREVSELRARLGEAEVESSFTTASAKQRAFLQSAERVAAAECMVLLRGESGTGKNVLARWIRGRSARSSGPFVTVHCPALSGDLMSSALFGHKKGAFTGAVSDAVGKIQESEGGTLFLDEVGDLNADAQARLLRFLNDRSYEHVGESKERKADVRLIAATNRDLEGEVARGRFREDLLFRLNVVPLTLLPLRERPEDVMPLARHYLRVLESRGRPRGFTFSPAAERAITASPWPGNLRELRNAVERGTILANCETLLPEDLGLTPASDDGLGPRKGSVAIGDDVTLEEVEREHIARVLARATSLEAAARTLAIDATTLQRKRKRYGLA